MGWASGADLMVNIIDAINGHIDGKRIRKKIYFDIIRAFEDADCDTLDECLGADKAFDRAYRELHPLEGEEEVEDD